MDGKSSLMPVGAMTLDLVSPLKVSLFAQSLTRWLLLVGILIALKTDRAPSTAVEWTLAISAGVLFLSAFFWPRCPHCGARVVQFNKRAWVAGDACWRCGKPYDEIRTPAYMVEFTRAVEEALDVRRKDPTKFEQLLQEAERRFELAFQADMASLRERSKRDVSAARTLRACLKSQLSGLGKTEGALRKALDKDSSAREGLRNAEAHRRALESELASLEANLHFPTHDRGAAV